MVKIFEIGTKMVNTGRRTSRMLLTTVKNKLVRTPVGGDQLILKEGMTSSQLEIQKLNKALKSIKNEFSKTMISPEMLQDINLATDSPKKIELAHELVNIYQKHNKDNNVGQLPEIMKNIKSDEHAEIVKNFIAPFVEAIKNDDGTATTLMGLPKVLKNINNSEMSESMINFAKLLKKSYLPCHSLNICGSAKTPQAINIKTKLINSGIEKYYSTGEFLEPFDKQEHLDALAKILKHPGIKFKEKGTLDLGDERAIGRIACSFNSPEDVKLKTPVLEKFIENPYLYQFKDLPGRFSTKFENIAILLETIKNETQAANAIYLLNRINRSSREIYNGRIGGNICDAVHSIETPLETDFMKFATSLERRNEINEIISCAKNVTTTTKLETAKKLYENTRYPLFEVERIIKQVESPIQAEAAERLSKLVFQDYKSGPGYSYFGEGDLAELLTKIDSTENLELAETLVQKLIYPYHNARSPKPIEKLNFTMKLLSLAKTPDEAKLMNDSLKTIETSQIKDMTESEIRKHLLDSIKSTAASCKLT